MVLSKERYLTEVSVQPEAETVMIWRAYLFILVNFYISFSVSFYRTGHGASHELHQLAHKVGQGISEIWTKQFCLFMRVLVTHPVLSDPCCHLACLHSELLSAHA